MHPFLGSKYGILISPTAIVDNASWTTNEIDTAGYDYLKIHFILGANDIAIAALAVTESDTSASGHANVTGLVASGTTGDGRLPTATDDDNIFSFFVDLRGRKRYIDVTATNGDGTVGGYAAGMYELCRAKETPTTSSEQGLGGRFIA